MRTTIEHVNGCMRQLTVHSHDLTRLSCDEGGDGDYMMIRVSDHEERCLSVFLPKRLAVELHQRLDAILSDQDIIAEKVD